MKNLRNKGHTKISESTVFYLIFQKDVSLKGDDLLGDLMEELHKGPADIPAPVPVKLTKKRPAPVSRYDISYTRALLISQLLSLSN